MTRFLLGVALGVLLCALASVAWGYGDASWIQNGQYSGGEYGNTHCCGPQDCGVIYPVSVQWGEKYVTVTLEDGTKFETPKLGVHPSKDWNFWLCRANQPGRGRCFFIPSSAGP